MDLPSLYGEGARALQDAFDSRRLADRLDRVTVHEALDERDRALVARQATFVLATVDADGWPDVSSKGGAPGFVRVSEDGREVRFPSYDGNGMFRSLGNIGDDGRVALLFVDTPLDGTAKPWRLRVHGRATVSTDPADRAEWEGAQAVVTVRVGRAFPNCGRYVHDPSRGRVSPDVPAPGHTPPVPGWKRLPAFEDVLPGSPREPDPDGPTAPGAGGRSA